jgi:small ligand-binding sensory domain FIST
MIMQWASALSQATTLRQALEECAASIRTNLGDTAPDLAVVFASSEYASDYPELPAIVAELLGPQVLALGCSGGGIIGGGAEIEQEPAVSLTAASLPGVHIQPIRLEGDVLPDMDAPPDKWHEALGVSPDEEPQFVLLADPMSFPAQNLLLGMDYAFPSAAKIGGLASAAQGARQNGLFLGQQYHDSGAVGVALSGNIVVETVVAQGCRPIGAPMHITKSDRNFLVELDGKQPLDVLRSLFQQADQRDRDLMQNSLFLGVVMDALIDEPQQGDFLIRNVMGMDQRSGVLAIGEMLKEGQLVQFHLRDADTSAEDLTAVLERYATDNRENPAHGALLFSCLGRGKYLYGKSNHDTEVFHDKVGEAVPLGGFFCNGEIGPVSGTTFLHGYTSSFGIFRPRI